MLLTIENDGPRIKRSNFWGSEVEQHGKFYLSVNAGAFRLLIPQKQEAAIPEFETAEQIIVCRGPWPDGGQVEAMEFIFDDLTDSPYRIQLSQAQVDRFPPKSDAGRECVFSAWILKNDAPACVFESKCIYQVVARLPIDVLSLRAETFQINQPKTPRPTPRRRTVCHHPASGRPGANSPRDPGRGSAVYPPSEYARERVGS